MAETALLPAGADSGEERKQKFNSMLADGRAIAIRDWLADLKTLLPDHAAYAASRSLHDWQQWAKQGRTVQEWAAAHSAIEVQGRIWRELLTGEKAARDILRLSDYHAAGRRVAKRVITRFWWVIAAAMLLIAGIIFAGLYLHGIPPSLRLVGGIAWLAGALGISVKGIGVLLLAATLFDHDSAGFRVHVPAGAGDDVSGAGPDVRVRMTGGGGVRVRRGERRGRR